MKPLHYIGCLLVVSAGLLLLSGQGPGQPRLGTMSAQNSNAVAVTGGTVNGTTIGGTTPGAGTFSKLLAKAPTNLEIASGAITVTQWHHHLQGEGDANDDLVTINGGVDGQRLVLHGPDANTITIKTTGNIQTQNDADLAFSGQVVELVYDGDSSMWVVTGVLPGTLAQWAAISTSSKQNQDAQLDSLATATSISDKALTLLALTTNAAWRAEIDAQKLTRANILDYGAVSGTGSDNAAFTSAIAALPSSKGIIEIPAGTYHVDSLPVQDGLYYIGQGDNVSVLTLNSGATADMFIASTNAELRGGGIAGLEIDGGGTTTYDCVEMDAADIVNNWHIDRCYIHDFRRGYNGSNNATIGFDRSISITRTEIQDCVEGVHAEEHPWMCMVWFHNCDTAITGRMLDGMVCYCRFGNCGIGGKPNATNTSWVANEFYDNGIGLITGGKTVVVGNKFTHVAEVYADIIGILVRGNGDVITGNHIGQDPGNDFTDGGIQFIGDGTHAATGQTDLTVISGNAFQCEDGPGIKLLTIAEMGALPRYIQITGNTFQCYGQRGIDTGSDAYFTTSNLSSNTFNHVSGTISSNGLIHYNTNGTGGIISNNMFVRLGGTAAVGISGTLTFCSINGNLFSGFTTPLTGNLHGSSLMGNTWGVSFTSSDNSTLPRANRHDRYGASFSGYTDGPGFADFQEDHDNGTSRIRVIGQSSLAGDQTLTLPDATGTFLYSSGPLGTPSSGDGTNLTNLPLGSITGLGTNHATALAANLADAATNRKSIYSFGSLNALSAADATTYYFGSNHVFAASTTANTFYKVYFPFACHIKSCRLVFVNTGANATTETSSCWIRLNNTTDTLVSDAVTNDAAERTFVNSSLDIAIAANDYIEMKWTTPTWATNPTGVNFNVVLGIEAD